MRPISLLLLWGCHPTNTDTHPGATTPSATAPIALEATATPAPLVSTVLHITWTAPAAGSSWVA
jgi:hypothetical protein